MDNITLPTPTTEEIQLMAWTRIRTKRDALMAATDWTQIADSPLSAEKKAEFAQYRQALRDLPQSTANPDDIAWPLKPE
ncbi:tail fiber assembly protein [Thalassomonas actiniarum]|uniref:Phage tail assembly chaperone n=1 Tax=Thalassomonas actiniarum TaxID=485447 RepID=A0AAE9YQF8_9GAMM|nr:tail fiber assembly protein [Thalassomonas actiniarum]WDD98373.1 phage tail assembly chaperone [Thalassomonas actiniarum]